MTEQQRERCEDIARELLLLFDGEYGKIEFTLTQNKSTYFKTQTHQYDVKSNK